MRTPPIRFRDRLTTWTVITAIGLAPLTGLANPLGEAVRHGDVQFERIDGHLRILQATDKAIIDWESFSISAAELTEFVQPGARSAALNRVRGLSASQIDGALRANGNILLINPNGIVVGPGGTIDVAGFIASTLDIPDAEFLAGGDLNFRGASQAGIINLGKISAYDGDLFLIARNVENSGTLSAPNGTVGLAAGSDVLIRASGDERVFVRAGDGTVTNTSSGVIEGAVAELKAHGGNVYGLAVKNEGRIAATGVQRQGGQIFLRANGGRIENSGTLKARNADGSGGRIEIDAGPGGSVEAGGEIDASGESGSGGEILILGSEINVPAGSLIIADGETGGGSIFVGGGRRGEDPALLNAQNVTVGEGAHLSANALGNGDGGQIIVFAEQTLDFQGRLSATGGPLGGNGGFAELSGKERVIIPDLFGRVDLSAVNGTGGTLLFDPIGVTVDGTPGPPMPIAPAGNPTTVDNQTNLNSQDISNFLEFTGGLIIETGPGAGSGDITLLPSAFINWSSNNNLTFNASRNFIMQGGSMVMSEGNGDFTANAGQSVVIDNGTIQTTGGTIFLNGNQGGAPTAGTFTGVSIGGISFVSSFNGNVEIHGLGGDLGDNNVGVDIFNEANVFAGGNLTIVGESRGTGSGNRGVVIDGRGAVSQAASAIADMGHLMIDGTGSASGSGNNNDGVVIDTGATAGTSFGDVDIIGVAGTGNNLLRGVAIQNNARVFGGPGGIQIGGTGGDGMDSPGVLLLNNADVRVNIVDSTPGGNIEITGTGINGNEGVRISNSDVSSVDGADIVIGGGSVTVDDLSRIDPGGANTIDFFGAPAGSDILTIQGSSNEFNVTADNAGFIDTMAITFRDFENIDAADMDDFFNFTNEATLFGLADGGPGGDDQLFVDLTMSLGTVTISEFGPFGQIDLNPMWNFIGIEGIQIDLGPTAHNVDTIFFSFAQTLDGGPGNDTLNFPGAPPGINPNGVFVNPGFGDVTTMNFEFLTRNQPPGMNPGPPGGPGGAPRMGQPPPNPPPGPMNPNPPFNRNDQGGILQHQIQNFGPPGSGPGSGPPGSQRIQNFFSPGFLPQTLQSLSSIQGAFSAFGFPGLGQVIIIGIDPDGGGVLFIPYAIGDPSVFPSPQIFAALIEALTPFANVELLQALQLVISYFLYPPDGPRSMEDGSAAAAAAALLLLQNLSPAAQVQLLAALQLPIVFILNPPDGPVDIDPNGPAPGQPIILIFNGLFNDEAIAELRAALNLGDGN